MTEDMPSLRNTILLSYDTRSFVAGFFLSPGQAGAAGEKRLQKSYNFYPSGGKTAFT